MTEDKLKAAKREAVRFLALVADLEKAREGAHRCATLPREHGFVRRASMDLTRSLADLRRAKERR